MGKRSRNSDIKHRYTLKHSRANTEVEGIPIGGIGQWVARLGGDDVCVEELLLFRECDFDGHQFRLILEQDDKKGVPNV